MPPRSRRALLWWSAAGIATGLAVASTVAVWLIFRSLDLESVVTRVEQAVEQATGRTLTIGSRPQLTFRPALRLVVGDVTLANQPGGSRPEMLALRKVEVGVNLKPLASGKPPGLTLTLVEPGLWLEVDKHGNANWRMKLSPEEVLGHLRQAVAILHGKVILESVTVERATLRYDDRRERRGMEIGVKQAVLAVKADDRYELRLEGTVASPALPIRLNTQLLGTAGGVRADSLRIEIGRSTIVGTIEADRLEPRPRIRGEIEAKVLDLAGLLAALPADRTPPAQDGRIIPATPLPLSGLRSLDADIRLQVGRLMLRDSHSIESLQATVRLADGRLAIEPFSAAIGSGRISGGLRLNTRASGTASLSADFRAKGVELGSLVALAGIPSAGFHNGPTDVAIQLASTGGSARALMAALDGHVRAVVGEGRVPGKSAEWSRGVIGQALDLINPYRGSEEGTPLKCAVVNVPVRRGIVSIKDTVAAESDKVVASVTGSADLGQERLDLILNSQTVKGIAPGLADFASAVRVTGTFASPALAVNAQGAAAAGLRLGAAIATAGVTLLAESAVRRAMPAHPCQAALSAKSDAQAPPAEDGGKKPGFLERLRGK